LQSSIPIVTSTKVYNTPIRDRSYIPPIILWRSKSMLTYHTEKYTPKAPTTQATKAVRLNVTRDRHSRSWFPVGTTGFNRFPFNNFTYCLTFFSKFFSSFPHGTCSLSVSRRYLALGEIYLPFWAAIPNNSTLWERIVKRPVGQPDGILTLHDTLSQRIWANLDAENASSNYNSTR
jgi:hypothetical protein